MKRNKILTAILGIAVLSGIICSGMVIAQGIRTGAALTHNVSARKESVPQPWELEKRKLEAFSEISINLSYCNLSILPGDDYYLEYHMDGSCEKPEYKVSKGRFYFQEGNTQTKYRNGFHLFLNPPRYEPYYVNLYVPEKQYFDLLELSNDSGNVEIKEIQAQNADIKIEYGNLDLGSFSGEKLSIDADSGNLESKTITCDTLDISNEYGNITGNTFQVSDKASITLDSGNLSLSKLEAGTLTVKDEYGNCSVEELKVKSSSISMDSGNIDFNQAELGTTDITSAYGDVSLVLTDSVSDYNYELHNEYGTVRLDGNRIKEDDDGEIHYQKDNQKDNRIFIECESGNINIR